MDRAVAGVPGPYSEWRDPSGLRFCLLYYMLLVHIDEAECGLSTHACNVLWRNLVPLFLLPLPLFLFLISGVHFSFGGDRVHYCTFTWSFFIRFPNTRENIQFWSFYVCLISFDTISSDSIHFASNDRNSFSSVVK